MTTQTHLITADSYVNKGKGLKHGDPTVSVRMPVAKKEELEKIVKQLVAQERTENSQDFLRKIIFKAIDEHKDLLENTPDKSGEDTIATTSEPPAKKRGRKPKVAT